MGSIGRRLERLEALEARSRAANSPNADGRPPWYTPERWAERRRRFEGLYAELGRLGEAAQETTERR